MSTARRRSCVSGVPPCCHCCRCSATGAAVARVRACAARLPRCAYARACFLSFWGSLSRWACSDSMILFRSFMTDLPVYFAAAASDTPFTSLDCFHCSSMPVSPTLPSIRLASLSCSFHHAFARLSLPLCRHATMNITAPCRLLYYFAAYGLISIFFTLLPLDIIASLERYVYAFVLIC